MSFKTFMNQHGAGMAFGAGIAGFIGTAVAASWGTIKIKPKFEDLKQDVKEFKEIYENEKDAIKTRTESERLVEEKKLHKSYVRDLLYAYGLFGVEIAKCYGPAIVLAGISTTLLVKAKAGYISQINTLTAAYESVNLLYNKYRENVREEIGEEKEEVIQRKTAEDCEELLDQIRESYTDAQNHKLRFRNEAPLAERRFDIRWDNSETSQCVYGDTQGNLLRLKAAQAQANDLLRSRGFLFLNELHTILGLSPTPEGQLVGWISNDDRSSYVDFGIDFDDSKGFEKTAMMHPKATEVEHYGIWLRLIADGIIYDKL